MRQGRVFCNGIAVGIITEDEQGYTFVGVEKDRGEERSECFFLEDHKVQWQRDYRCILEFFQQKTANQKPNNQK